MPIPSGGTATVELQDLKDHLQITGALTGSDSDGEMQGVLDAAISHLERLVGPLSTQTVTERLSARSGSPLILSHTPVVSLTSLAYTDGTTVDVDDLDANLGAGLVYWNYGTTGYFSTGTRNVTVVYEAGRASLPDDLRLAVLLLAADMWETQHGGGTLRPAFPGEDPEDTSFSRGGFPLLPPRVEALIRPHRLAPVLA